MASLKDVVLEAGRKLGLRQAPDGKSAYGAREGFLVQVSAGEVGNSPCLVETVRHGTADRDQAVRDAIGRSKELEEKGVKVKTVIVKDGIVVRNHLKPAFRSIDAEAVAGEIDALVRAIREAGPAPAAACRICGGSGGGEPMLLNGVVDRVCPACVERLQHEARKALEEYERRPLNLPLALAAAAVLAVVGGAVWAGLAILTQRMFAYVGIGIGFLVGWGTLKAAGKGGLVVQVLAAAFTVASVLLGEVFWWAYLVQQSAKKEGGTVDWGDFVRTIPDLLKESTGDTIFALVCGLVGAYGAIQIAGKPKLEVKAEK